MKKFRNILTALLLAFFCLIPALPAQAKATDEIRHFYITVDVREDGTLNMIYDIEWLVLDSDDLGPLEWVDLGMPNSNYSDIVPLTDTISKIKNAGNNVNIYLDKKYYEGESVQFAFSFVQSKMYQIDKYYEGETVYSFTPAWFDGIEVDDLKILWKDELAGAWQPECQMENGYLVWESALNPGDRYTISVVYPNDAFGFTEEGSIKGGSSGGDDDWDDDWDDDGETSIFEVLGWIAAIVLFAGGLAFPIIIVVVIVKAISGAGRGFGSASETEKKITRTKIVYYDFCPGCGSARTEGKDDCEYCGRSMIKSKDVVEEKEIKNPEKYSTNGTFRYGSDPNTYIHVNVVNIPRPRPTSTRTSHRSSCVSSCAHSSCASSCACASHCACACACASSGRAGCSVKNFFNRLLHNERYSVDSKEKAE